MRRFFDAGSARATASWAAVGVVLVATAWSVRIGAVGWTLFGLGLTVVLLVPPVAFRTLRTTSPWPASLLAAIPFALGVAGTGGPVGDLAAHAAAAGVAILVVVQIDTFTQVEMNRGSAVAMVVGTTMTAAGVWELATWTWDRLAGTSLVESNDGVMWRLVWATVAGIFGGALFDRYLRHLPQAELVPDGFEPADASDEVDAAGDAVTGLLAHLGLAEERQRLLARGLQLALSGLVVAGLVTLDLNVVVNAGVGLGATLLPGVLRRDYHLPIDAGLTLWIAVAVFLHVLGSSGLYQTVWGWHNLTHAVSGTLVAGVGYTAVSAVEAHTDAVSFPVEFTFVFVVPFVFSVGVLWEMLEFTLDGVAALAGTEDAVLAQHGLENTMSDMMANTLGALVVATAATLWRSNRLAWLRHSEA